MVQLEEKIDYLAQQMLQEQGVLPMDFYQTSMSDYLRAQNAKKPEDQLQDPLALMRLSGANQIKF